MNFENTVSNLLKDGLSLNSAIKKAAFDYPDRHAEYLFRASNGIPIRNLSAWPEHAFADFRDAVKNIRNTENW